MNYLMSLEKLLEVMIDILPPIIRTKDFDLFIVLGLNETPESLKCRKTFD